MVTAVFFNAVTIHLGEKHETLPANLFVQSESLLYNLGLRLCGEL